MPKLTITTAEKMRDIKLAALNSMGRHPGNKICLKDPMVSNSHCLIYLTKKRNAVIKDLGSRNGTWVNQNRITGHTTLMDGDEIHLGNTRCTFSTSRKTLAERMVQVEKGRQAHHLHSKVAHLEPEHFLKEADIGDELVLRADYEKLRVTHELQRDMGLLLDIPGMLEKILDRTSEFLSYDRGVVLLADRKGALTPSAFKTTDPGNRVTLSSTLIRKVREEKVGVLSSDALTDKRFDEAQSVIVQGIHSTLAVPILHQDELLGILVIDSLEKVDAYTEKDLHLLTNIANQTGQLIKNVQLARKIESDAVTRERFQRLLSPDLAELVVSGGLKVEKGGENRVATVLFADIRGFTAMSEAMPADQVLCMLNDYYEVVVERIFRHEGTVDKFIGDEIMVIWGAPVSHDDDPVRAVQAALDIQSVLAGFRRSRKGSGDPPIHVGIGINTGKLVAGYIGSTQTMSYSVIGDTVNTASRLCAAARADQILISQSTLEKVQHQFEVDRLEPIRVKGKSKPVQTYAVVCGKKASQST